MEGGLGLGGGGAGAGGAAATATCTAEMPYVEGKLVPSCPMGSRCSADKDWVRPGTEPRAVTEATASTMMEPGRGLPGRIWTWWAGRPKADETEEMKSLRNCDMVVGLAARRA